MLRHRSGVSSSTRRDPRVPVQFSKVPAVASRLLRVRRPVRRRAAADVRKVGLGELVTPATTTTIPAPASGGSGHATTAAVEADVPGVVGCRLELGEAVYGVNLAERTSLVYTCMLDRHQHTSSLAVTHIYSHSPSSGSTTDCEVKTKFCIWWR